MNERIQEIAKLYNIDISIDGMGYGEGNIEGIVTAVVRECVNIAFQNDIAKFTEDGYRIGLDIEKYFGLEQ